MAKIPDSAKASPRQRLSTPTLERWPQLDTVNVRSRTGFAYIRGHLPDGEQLPLCRLRYTGSASRWGFATWT